MSTTTDASQSTCTEFWKGEFGDEYTERNKKEDDSNRIFFLRTLASVQWIKDALEIGANCGRNLMALRKLFPFIELSAVEVNDLAVSLLEKLDLTEIYHKSVTEQFPGLGEYDLVISKGLLIHIPPEDLPNVYELMHKCCRKYILIAEYYNPTPVEVEYRGNKGKLFKRDFAGEMLDRYPDLKMRRYGFVYHRDEECPQDDLTWFLLEKENDA